MEAWELADRASREGVHTTTCEQLEDALAQAEATGKGVVVCGSLYLAAQARPRMLYLAGRDL